jgi:hypothetical protein
MSTILPRWAALSPARGVRHAHAPAGQLSSRGGRQCFRGQEARDHLRSHFFRGGVLTSRASSAPCRHSRAVVVVASRLEASTNRVSPRVDVATSAASRRRGVIANAGEFKLPATSPSRQGTGVGTVSQPETGFPNRVGARGSERSLHATPALVPKPH